MIRRSVAELFARLRERWAVDDPEDRIEGSGEVYLDPAYNGRYTAERRLQQLSAAQEAARSEGVVTRNAALPPDEFER